MQPRKDHLHRLDAQLQGGVDVPSYTAAKSAVAGLVKALANEWASKGVNVNAVAPGYIATDNTQALRDDAERNRAIVGRITVGRWGEPGKVAGAYVFLSSAASDYVHGVVLPVDGGWMGEPGSVAEQAVWGGAPG